MKITAVTKGSQAETKGLREGDKVIAVGNGPARDYIDLMYYGAEEDVRLIVHRGAHEFSVMLSGEEDFGLEFEPMKIQACGNHCMFCFIDQNPPGMRNGIYIKDEDYRLSFLHGSYVTLTALDTNDLQRIVSQRLSPLYVSVHATDTPARMKLLGLKKDDRLLEKMDRLLTAGIQLHCQIVVCPGINDTTVLEHTIDDLRKRYPGILSVAVVPVGLTKHRADLPAIKPVGEEDARTTIRITDGFHDRFQQETGEGFVYCADEWYIRAGFDMPPKDYYDDFPQIENGVGMLRDFLDATSSVQERLTGKLKRTGKFVFITGTLMSPYIEDFTGKLSAIPGLNARTITVHNRFYGSSVTVSGLLTGGDIRSALENVLPGETVILPPNCLNESGMFLDDISPDDIAEKRRVKIIRGDYDPVSIFL